MKKRVCIIHKVTRLDPRSFYKQARSLAKYGFETTLLGIYTKNQVIDGITLIGFKAPRTRLIRFFITNLHIFVAALKQRAHVYHFHDLDFILWAVLLKALTNSKVIYDVHESYPEYMLLKTYIPGILRKHLSSLVYILEHVSVRFFDAVVPNDNFVAEKFSHKNKVAIFNFPTIDFFRGKKYLSFNRRQYDLFYHGSLPKYHFETMLKIAERLNSQNIKNRWGIIMDRFSPESWAKQEVRKRNLQENFVFLPYADYLEVADYLNMSKIGIIPLPPFKKFQENIPLKIFEYMGMGMPVVLSDLPPTRQFINGRNCAIAVEPNDVNRYVEAIKLLLDNPIKSIKMGQTGQKLVFDHFNWNQEEKKLINLYQQLTCN
ncbi:MAG: glycosyltransferase family 4 protein [Desulfobacterales bacterium]